MNTGKGYSATAAALFEAAMLVRCTGVCPGRGTAVMRDRPRSGATVEFARHAGPGAAGWSRSSAGHPAVAADRVEEFARLEAADRLAGLLIDAGCPSIVETYTAGNRHRYRIHRVVAVGSAHRLLESAWRSGFREVCARPDRHLTPRRRRHLLDLATAAWRAALLVTGPARTMSPGVPVTDLGTATVLLRAGRCLDVPIRLAVRPGGRLVLVPPLGAARVRLAELSGLVGLPAETARPAAA